MDIVQRITQIIEPSLTDMGFRLVQVKLAEGSRTKTLTVMAERLDGTFMSFDDCAEISQTASALMDVEDPITGAYNLEVCSPGIDRPLTRLEDFERYKNYEIKAETLIPVDGRKRFRGTVAAVNGEQILLKMPDGVESTLTFGNIRAAKLVLTDALVAEAMKKTKENKQF